MEYMSPKISSLIGKNLTAQNIELVILNFNRMGTTSLKNESPEVGSNVWDWRVRSIEIARNARIHPRAARTRAKRAFKAKFNETFNQFMMENLKFLSPNVVSFSFYQPCSGSKGKG